MIEHMLDQVEYDRDDWAVSYCACGWVSPGCPGPEEAANFWGQHLLAQAPNRPPVDVGWCRRKAADLFDLLESPVRLNNTNRDLVRDTAVGLSMIANEHGGVDR